MDNIIINYTHNDHDLSVLIMQGLIQNYQLLAKSDMNVPILQYNFLYIYTLEILGRGKSPVLPTL